MSVNRINFEKLVENAPDVIVVYDLEYRHTYVNWKITELTGIPREKYIGRTNKELGIPESMYGPLEEQLKQAVETKKEQPFQFNFMSPGGKRYIEARITPDLDGQGNVVSLTMIARDVTEKSLYAEKINTMYRSMNNVLESISDGYFSLDRDLRIRYFNGAAGRLLNRNPEELQGKLLLEVFPEAKGSVFEQAYRNVLRTGKREQVVTYFDVEPYSNWYSVQVYPQQDGITVFFQVLTEERKMKEALTVSEEKYRVLFETFPLGISVSDETGNIIEANKMSEKILEVPEPDQGKRTLSSNEWIMVDEDGNPAAPDAYPSVRALQNRKKAEGRLGIKTPDGRIKWLGITAAPIPLEGYGVVVTYNDITKLKETDNRLIHALKEKEELLRELYHRTKNNMQVISSMMELQILKDPEGAQAEFLRGFQSKIKSMALVHQKLYQSNTLSLINLKEYLEELTAIVVQTFSPDTLTVSLDLELDNIMVSIDEAIPCGLIINELILNSLKHGFPEKLGGNILLRMKQDGNDAVFEYRDNGAGFSGPVDFESFDAIGLQTIKSIAEHQLEGKMEIDGANGFNCRFRFNIRNFEERVFQ
jgi:PAS domain S-box-containing protein